MPDDVTREEAIRAWIALWNALDKAETYIGEQVKGSQLHMEIHRAVVHYNPYSRGLEQDQGGENEH